MGGFSASLEWFNLKSFSKYIGGNMTFQIATILCEFVVLRLISQEEVGLIQFALLIQSYLVISRLGVLNAFNLEYPLSIAQNKTQLAKNYLETTSAHVLLSMLLQILIFFGIGLYYTLLGQNELGSVMLLMALYTLFEAWANYGEAQNRSELNFSKISKARSMAVIIVLISLLLPYFIGIYGAVIRLVGIQVCLVLLYRTESKKIFKFNLLKATWLQLFKTGWKLWLWSYLKSVGKSFPRLYVISFLGISFLGLYAPVQWILASFILFTSSVSSYIYPKLTHLVAKEIANISSLTLVLILFTIGLLMPFAFVANLVIEMLFENLFPEYIEAIPAMKIVIWASLLEVFSIVSSSWVSQKKWTFMFWYVGLALLFRGSGMLIPYLSGEKSLVSVAWGILAASIAISITIVVMVFLENRGNRKKYIHRAKYEITEI